MEEAIYRTNAFSSPSIDYSHVIICYPFRARPSLFISHSPHIHNTHASYIRMRWKYERCMGDSKMYCTYREASKVGQKINVQSSFSTMLNKMYTNIS